METLRDFGGHAMRVGLNKDGQLISQCDSRSLVTNSPGLEIFTVVLSTKSQL
jgi:hypothetical protein